MDLFSWMSIAVITGFCILIGFEIRIVTYLKQMRDLLEKFVSK